MTGFILAIVCIIVSIVLAVVQNGIANPMLWALYAIFVVLLLGAKWPWPIQ